jgi:hypothetical protein
MPRYQAIDCCTDPDCSCLDMGGRLLYDGPSLDAAVAALSQARYPGAGVIDVASGAVVGVVSADGYYYPREGFPE